MTGTSGRHNQALLPGGHYISHRGRPEFRRPTIVQKILAGKGLPASASQTVTGVPTRRGLQIRQISQFPVAVSELLGGNA
jgi:hypothetical protein